MAEESPSSVPVRASSVQGQSSAVGGQPQRRGPGRPRKDPNAPLRISRAVFATQQSTRPPRIKAKLRLSASSSSPSTSSPSSTPGLWDLEMTDSPVNVPLAQSQPTGDNQQLNVHRCAFCYLPASSLLGQGDLQQHTAPESVDLAEFTVVREPRTEPETGAVRRPRTKEQMKSLLERNEVLDESEIIGLLDDVQINELIEPNTRQMWAHFCCAAWSDGVTQAQESTLQGVARAVGAGLRQQCTGCEQYGATISCQERHCPNKYHYPCASAYGGYLDIKQLVFFCPQHVERATQIVGSDGQCVKCDTMGRLEDMLFCTLCGRHYHGGCLEPSVDCGLRVRAGWQCPDCKRCQQCQSAADDSRMLVCENCDKGYHTYCMSPVLTTIPKVSWKCKYCRVCNDCGSRTPGSGQSSRWHLNYTICDSCYQQRNKGLYCPVCTRAYRHQKHKTMTQCGQCKKQIHFECDPEAAERADGSDYVCVVCKSGAGALFSSRPSTSYSPSVSNADDDEALARAFLNEMVGVGPLSNASSPCPFPDLGPDFDDSDIFSGAAQPSTSSASVPLSESTCRVPNAPPPRTSCGVSRKKPGAAKRGRSSGQGKGKTGVFRNPTKCRARRSRTQPGSVASQRPSEDSSGDDAKHKEDEEYIRTVVVTSNKDEFTFCQDICLICGSFGKGDEGVMVGCTQCGQFYHPYCANAKLSAVVLKRGWRCLDCTVCELCGRGSDEQKLLLCDECDVSYHIYCLNPPMERIPQGAWRCKWCAKCCRCNAPLTDSSHRSDGSFNLCAACSSLRKCPVCQQVYKENDLVITCQNCKRLCHGKCEELFGEDMLEAAADRGFRCRFCRPQGSHTHSTNSMFSDTDEALQYTSDFVLLTKSGLDLAQWQAPLIPPPVVNVALSKSGSSLTAAAFKGASQSIVDTIDQVTAAVTQMGPEHNEQMVDFERIESVEDAVDTANAENNSGTQQKRQRGRRVQKIGVGGFFVRPTRQRSTTNDGAVAEQAPQPSEDQPSATTGDGTEDANKEGAPAGPVKVRRKRRPRKSQLEDSYPAMIQKCFFGATFVPDRSSSPLLDEARLAFQTNRANSCELSPRMSEHLRKQQQADKEARVSLQPFDDQNFEVDPSILNDPLKDMLPEDPASIFNILDEHEEQEQQQNGVESGFEQLIDSDMVGGLTDMGPTEMDSIINNLTSESNSVDAPPTNENMLGSNTQSSIPVAHQTPVPLTPGSMNQPRAFPQTAPQYFGPGPATSMHDARLMHPTEEPAPGPFVQAPDPASLYQSQTMHQTGAQMNLPPTTSVSPFQVPAKAPTPVSSQPAAAEPAKANRDEPVTTDKSNTERWEQDEPLGPRATIAAVLYANVNYPELQSNHPNWPERVKQIQKLWRALESSQRQIYVQRARENRAANKQQRTKRPKAAAPSELSLMVETPSNVRLPDAAQSPQSNPSTPFTAPRTPATPIEQPFSPRMTQAPIQQSPGAHHELQRPFSGMSGGQMETGVCPSTPEYSAAQQRAHHLFKVPTLPGQMMQRPGGPDPMQHMMLSPEQQHHMMMNRPPVMYHQTQTINRPTSLQVDSKPLDPNAPVPMSPTIGPRIRQQGAQHLLLEDLLEQERQELFDRSGNPAGFSQPQAPPAAQPAASQAGAGGVSPYNAPQQQWPMRPGQEISRPAFEQEGVNMPMPPGYVQQPPDPQHQSLAQRHHELDGKMKVFEAELTRMRKQKKNLTAKQRQLRKNTENPQELAPHDQSQLENLSCMIQRCQKELEPVKKQAKQALAQLHEYQNKHGIVPPPPMPQPQPTTPTTLGLPRPPMAPFAQGQPMYGPPPPIPMPPRTGAPNAPQRMVPPPYPTDQPLVCRPPVQQHQQPMLSPSFRVVKGDTNPFSEDFVDRDQVERPRPPAGLHYQPRMSAPEEMAAGFRPPFVGGPNIPGQQFGLARPPVPQQLLPSAVVPRQCQEPPFFCPEAAMGEPKRKRKRQRKKDDNDSPLGYMKDPGSADSNIGPAGMLQHATHQLSGFRAVSPMDGESGIIPEVCSVVSFLVDRVSLDVDGEEAERGNALLKRLLQNNSPDGRVDGGITDKPPVQMTAAEALKRAAPPPVQGQQRPQPRKRIRKSKNKPYPYNSDELTVFLERISIQLKGLPRVTVLEPRPRADRSSCQPPGVTFLPDRPDKPMTVCRGFGSMSLEFMPDYYRNTFGRPEPPPPVPPAPPARMTLNPDVPEQQMERVLAHPCSSNAVPQPNLAILKQRSDSPLNLVYDSSSDHDSLVYNSFNYPAMKMVMPVDGRLSPNFTLMAQFPFRTVPDDPPIDLFVQKMTAPSESQSGLVPVSLTLDVEAAKNVESVMENLAVLLNLPAPIKYEVQIDTPPQTPEKAMVRELLDKQQEVCRQCESKVKQVAIRKRFAELGLTPNDEAKDDVFFCSHSCYFQFALTRKTPLTAEEIKKASELEPSLAERLLEQSDQGRSLLNTGDQMPVKTTENQQKGDDVLDLIIASVVGGAQPSMAGVKEKPIHVRDLPRPGTETAVSKGVSCSDKRWKGHRWQVWNKSMNATFDRLWDELNRMIHELRKSFIPSDLPEDCRQCELCWARGDGETEGTGRLLNMDADRWIHVNCALWSSEVYETISGALINVDQAVNRGRTSACVRCEQMGATLQCYKLRCDLHYHFSCAQSAGCVFLKDKTVFCREHGLTAPNEQRLRSAAVLRRVCVERDENRLIAKLFQQGEAGGLALRVGSLLFQHVGQLLPSQLKAFHTKDYIYPAGYSVTRIYWSTSKKQRRVRYDCSIGDKDGLPQFVVGYSDESGKRITCAQATASLSWSSILAQLERVRDGDRVLKLFPRSLRGESLFGLAEPSILKMIESLPGVDTLMTYAFKHGGSPLMDLPLAVNPSGCARCEPRFRTYVKRHCTVHAGASASSAPATNSNSSGLSEYQLLLQLQAYDFYQRFEPGTVAASSKWTQYKKMKQEWRNTVYLARSRIQGLGLYAKRDIEMNSMIIEYIGDVIRNEVVEKREKLYTQQNRGVYMFRVDTERVVDATMAGGPARYVNHSCDPNCSTQLLTMSNGDIKIIIIACRPISKGEELTYDYQFDFEDASSKIPCMCGAPNCRKWMN